MKYQHRDQLAERRAASIARGNAFGDFAAASAKAKRDRDFQLRSLRAGMPVPVLGKEVVVPQ